MVNALSRSLLVLCIFLHPAADVGAQPRAGALAIDEGQGDQYGWAVDHQTAAAAREAALRECGAECSVVLTFGRCAAYAADQVSAATAFGWGESYASADGARQRALPECRTRGGSGCMVRVWGCNGPVVEEELGLDRATRRQIQQGLHAEGFNNPGGADGLFGPQTRAAIRRWQGSRGAPTTGYLDGPAAAALRSAGVSSRAAAAVAPAGSTPGNAGSDNLFWQSIMNSANPADFDAYLQQFPDGIFVALARNRLAALRAPAGDSVAVTGPRTGGAGSPASESRFSGSPVSSGSVARSVSADPVSPIRANETCDGKPAGAACWMQVYQRPGCYVWNGGFALDATVTWTGECGDGVAQGAGTLTWARGGNQRTDTGRLVDGKKHGHWIRRYPNAEKAAGWGGWDVSEGPFVNGMMHGHWLLRATTSGTTSEGPFVDGQQTGHWVDRTANGNIQEGPRVNGVRHGRWIWRSADGDDVIEMLYVEGEQSETKTLKFGGDDVR